MPAAMALDVSPPPDAPPAALGPAPIRETHPEVEAVKSNAVPLAIGAAVVLGLGFLAFRALRRS
jgi:hypothetical protein